MIAVGAMIVIMVVASLAALAGFAYFAWNFTLAIGRDRPLLRRRRRTLLASVAAVVMGGAAGALGQRIFEVQMEHAEAEWLAPLPQLYWFLPTLAMTLFVVCLPGPLLRLCRIYTRSRRRADGAR
jgi:hypothetical protein